MYELGTTLGETTVESGTNVLVSGPPSAGKRRRALDILARGARESDGSIIVTTRDSADCVEREYDAVLDDCHGPVGIVDCVTEHGGDSEQDSERIKYTSSPMDMTGIGIRFSEFIEEFRDERGIERNRVLVDSLTTLLQYSNLQTVFRFVHVLTSRIETADALGIHLLEPTAHDEETTGTLRQLFDGSVEVDEEGSVVDVSLPDGSNDREPSSAG